MPATLRTLVADRALGLRPLCAEHLLDRAISWVHISELTDPTLYLDGGELLLTTGLGMDARTDVAAFVGRLADHGLSGLGFGTGLSHDTVPPALLDAARERHLPLLEIPERTPFIAITKAASAALAADAYAQVVRTDEAQRALTAAALGSQGTARVLRRLAQRLDAWVLLLDAAGEVEHAVPRAAARHRDDLGDEIDRVRRHRGPTSVTVASRVGQAVLQPLRVRGRGILAVGREAGFAPADMQIIGSAVSVLTLLHASTAAVDRVQRDMRAALLRMALVGQGGAAREIATDLWGPQPEPPLRVVAFRGRPGALAELVDTLEAQGPEHPPLFFAVLDACVVALAGAEGPALAWLAALPGQHPGTHAGVSDPVGDDTVAEGRRQARQAVEAAQRSGAAEVRFDELAGTRLLDLVGSTDAETFAEALLAPLLRHDAGHRGDLVASLREWLGRHGQWDPAAARLGVHRHTLRHRMRRVEELLGRTLDSPGLRAELWFALQVLDR
jgi:PucR family transcriptional regulator, purine catabolism regulatory protein